MFSVADANSMPHQAIFNCYFNVPCSKYICQCPKQSTKNKNVSEMKMLFTVPKEIRNNISTAHINLTHLALETIVLLLITVWRMVIHINASSLFDIWIWCNGMWSMYNCHRIPVVDCHCNSYEMCVCVLMSVLLFSCITKKLNLFTGEPVQFTHHKIPQSVN